MFKGMGKLVVGVVLVGVGGEDLDEVRESIRSS
jgi:hypothetical protein